MNKLFLFDLDGVLLDSKDQMAHAWDAVRKAHDVDVPFEEYFAEIGRPFRDIIHAIAPERSASEWTSFWRTYRLAALSRPDLAKPYPDTIDVITQLRLKYNCGLGIVTSKDLDRTERALTRIHGMMDVIITSDYHRENEWFRGKPAPDYLLIAMAIAHYDPGQTYYIGDMPVDCEAARRARIKYVQAMWGYGSVEDIDIIKINKLRDLVSLL